MRFDELLEDGTLKYDELLREFYATASDGAEVSLGNDESDVRSYLETHPTSDLW